MENMKTLTYCCPTKIYLGFGAHKRLPEILAGLGVKHLLFLSDHGVATGEIFALVKEILAENGVAYDSFTDIEPEPGVGTVERAFCVYQADKAQALLALGGGSVMDVAKAVGILATNGGRIQDYEGIDKFRKPPLPIVALPTTAGTGSEVSGSCVITDSVRGVKMSIRSAALNPAKVAILDPIGLRSLPVPAATYAAMDAFVHALESYVSLNANPVSDAMNLYAIELISSHVRPFIADRRNPEPGLKMLSAASLAAMGFSNTGAGNIHCMARFIGAFFHVPHGLANAVCLPYGAEFNLMANPEKFARVALAMGENITGLSAREAGRKAIEAMKTLCKDLNIPLKLRDIGVRKERVGEMAKLAFEADYNRWNPRYTTLDDFVSLFESAF